VKDFSPVRSCSDELCDCVCECRIGIDMKHWKRILAIVHATGRKDDGDEM